MNNLQLLKMNITELLDGIYYVGVNDRTSRHFEGLWSLPYGVSYNSYIIEGEKIALIDTVHISQSLKFITNIKSIIGSKNIDYLVINHMEPDHSGSIAIIKEHYPNIQIVGNSKTASMIDGYYGIKDNVKVITDNDKIDLGLGKCLSFKITPMVHWPETMVTYECASGTLFSGDAFGCFGALNGGIIDYEMDIEHYIPEMFRYYSNIVAKYGSFVQKALDKMKGLKINMICPTHGPVWSEYIMHVIDVYDRLSKYTPDDGVVIVYGSMYGNTEEVAELIARELAKNGITNIKMYNVSTADLSFILADICRYKGLIIGCPTYSNGIFPPMETLLNALVTREVKNRVFTCFGSFTWAPGISKKLMSYAETLKFDIVESNLEIKQSMTQDNGVSAKELVGNFLLRLKNN